MLDFWRPLFESPDIPDGPRFVDSVQHPTLYHLQVPVSLLDIASALRGLGESAPGPDCIKATTIKSLPPASLARLFNCWLWVGAVPPTITLNAVTFILKVKGSVEPGEYRPITVGSHLVRLFHRKIAI